VSKLPSGFSYEVQGKTVVISRYGKRASVLRGSAANRFLGEVESGDPQELMARATGNYKHGNERAGKAHPRSRRDDCR
jgi:hypothetical protein